MTLKVDAKFKGKLIRGLKNDIRYFVNFHVSNRKSENLHFDELFLSNAYKGLDEKVRKSCASWHWRVMQSLKKNWLLVSKMTWGIWWILMWALASLKILNFDMLLLSIAYNVSAKKVKKNDLSLHWKVVQTLKKNWLFVWKITWGI